MATDSYKDYLLKYGSPGSTHIIRNEEGAMVGSTQAGSDVDKSIQAGQPVFYTNTPGQFTTTPPASVSLDKETGAITVKAPKSVVESKGFQDKLSILKNYSQAYKLNPDTKIKSTDAEGNETGEELTVEQYITKLNTPVSVAGSDKKVSPIQQAVMYQDYLNRVNLDFGNHVKIMDAEGNIKPAHLTEAQITKMTQFGQGDDVNKDTRIVLPKGVKELEKAGVYTNMNWDENTSSLPIGTFQELWYKRNTSRNEILSTFEEIEQYLLKWENQPMMEESADMDEYVEMYALYNYMIKNDPYCDLWHGIGDALMVIPNATADVILGGSVLIGTGTGLLMDAVYNLESAVAERILNFSDEQKARMKKDKGIGQEAYEQLTDATNTLKRLVDTNWDVEKAYQYKDSNYTFNDAADAAEAIVEGLENLAIMISAGNALADLAKSGTAALANATNLTSTIGRIVGTVEGASGSAAAQALTLGTAMGIEGASVVSSGIGTLTALLGAKGASTLLNMTSWFASNGVVNFGLSTLAESVGEALFQNPQQMAALLTGNSLSSEANTLLWENYAINTLYDLDTRQAVLDNLKGKSSATLAGLATETYLGNVVGGVVGIQAAEGLMKLGQTTFGKVATALARKQIYKLQANLGDALDAFRIWAHKDYADIYDWIDNIKDPTKREVAQLQRILRAKKAEVAAETVLEIAGKSKDDIIKQLNKLQDTVDELMSLENAIDDLQRGGTLRIAEWTNSSDNPLFAAADKKIRNLTGKILDLESSNGLISAAKVNAGALFSKETTEYIGASVRVPILESALESAKQAGRLKDAKAIQSEIAHWTSRIANYESSVSSELLATAKEYVGAYKNWWKEANDLWLREGLLDASAIEQYRKFGIWGENGELYARLQRKQEMSDYVIRRRDGKLDQKLINDLGHYNWGSTEEFVDPMLVMQDELRRQANASLRQQIVKDFYGANGATVAVGADEMRLATEVKPLLTKYRNEAKEAPKTINEMLETKGVFQNAVKRSTLKTEARTASRAAQSLESATQPRIKVSSGQQQMAIAVMTDNQVDDFFNLVYDNKSFDDVLIGMADSTAAKQAKKVYRPALNEMKEKGLISNNRFTPENIALANEYDSTLPAQAKRVLVSNDPKALKEPYLQGVVQDAETMRWNIETATLYAEETAKAERLSRELGLADDSIATTTREVLNSVKEDFMSPKTAMGRVAEDVATQYGGSQPEAVKEYLFWQAMYENRQEVAKQVTGSAKQAYKKVTINGKKLTPSQYEQYAKQLGDEVKFRIKGYRDYSRGVLGQVPDAAPLLEKGYWQEEIYDEARKITDLKKGNNIIAIQNADGATELVKVDPLIADFVTAKPAGRDMGAFGKANYLWMKLFRMGTTGINPSSMVNQEFRDLGNAWIMGNVSNTLRENQKILTEVFGENPGALLSQYSQEAQDNFLKLAKEQGKNIEEVIAEAEVGSTGRAGLVASASTETESLRLLKQTREMWYEGGIARDSSYNKLTNAIDTFTEKAGFINEKREKYLRNLVYGNNFTSAIKAGRSIQSARIYAEFMASNATTNFSRATSFMSSLQGSVPYLRAAINGSKSFWRLWSIDPVGVTGRLLGGLGIPVVGLTTMSLSSPENREAYKNIKEYQKENSLPVVVNGEVYMLPLPQELSAFVNPLRQAVESAFGLGTGAGLELVVNDILALSPIDLGGFTDLDSWRLYGTGVDWGERLTQGSAQLFSQVMPKYITAMATAASGRDLYTGKKIDTSYTTVNPDTGEIEVISYTSGALANKIHEIFPNLSAPVAQDMLENIFGVAGNGILDFLVEAGNAVYQGSTTGKWWEAAVEATNTTVEGLSYSLTKPIHPYISNAVQKEWKNQIGALWEEKKAILSGDAWQSYIKLARNATSEKDIQAAATARANIIDPFYDKVKNVVNGLISGSGMEYTPTKYASILSLMNLEMTTSVGSPSLAKANEDAYKEAKRAAVSTMERLGFPSVSTSSALGTLKTGTDGSVYIQYATPLEILNMEQTYYAQSEIHRTEIENMLESAGINRSDMFTEYYAATTKAAKKQAKYNWNTKVVRALFPYIERYGAKNVINNQETVDLLSRYIFVDNPYNAKSYLQKIFGD